MKIVEFDGHDLTGDYAAYPLGGDVISLPSVQVQATGRVGAWPVISGVGRPGRTLTIVIQIVGEDKEALRTQLYQWFDPEGETPGKLVGVDDSGGGRPERYVYALCQALQPMAAGGRVVRDWMVATMVVDGDVRWRSVSTETVVWPVTVDGDTVTVSNPGDDEAYPVLTIEATAGGAPYRRFVPIVWRAVAGATSYPLQIGGLDTATLVTAGKMQSDGSDLRVESDGLEVDRWLYNMDSADTDIWLNLDFDAAVAMTLNGGIDDDDTTIVVNEAIAALPSSGLLLIESEVVAYASKNDGTKTFSGCTRGARNTTAAAHADDTAVHWLQHDVYLYYGGDAAQTADDDYKPILTLASSDNGTWDYDEFGEDDGLRTGAWATVTEAGVPVFYTGNQGGSSNPWAEIGVSAGPAGGSIRGYWYLQNPCYIAAANFQNGEKYGNPATEFLAYIIRNGLATEYVIPVPSLDATWEAWSRNETLAALATLVGLRAYATTGKTVQVEVADVTLTLNSSYTPVVTIGSESAVGSRTFAASIINNQTGDALAIAYIIALNDELEIDTDAKTVTDLSDGSRQMQALTLVGGPRRHWLKLEPGDNELEWTETSVLETTVTVEFEARYYD